MALSPDRLAQINGSDALDRLREIRRTQEVYEGLRDKNTQKGIGALAERVAGVRVVHNSEVAGIKGQAARKATEEFDRIAFPLRHQDASEQFVIPNDTSRDDGTEKKEVQH